ncbi:D-tyrosyl-tRNA(Tyr) deacylase [Hypnocyclicus thermotrophus]|uniref:D-aminoacyl-tRNA deacylase n=1 Tax=Hypnocyclicus thermotrophus TaxID=1627895 RepID=A0AA46I6C4_9FUSO|nr:D-aminoacyl-tRNA deacylase [Hypnocyclicus thermotrophus]TDT72251.1 D-tyrosyl-tRNA(Tyr) deacylase [Hypnocyclicus thermotrophus]
MKIVLQKVKTANVKVKNEVVGEISKGIVIFLGINNNDTEKEADWLVNKIIKLRIFEDENKKMNNSLIDIDGEILIVSQFTLYGDCRKGLRPSFTEAASPKKAKILYDYFVEKIRKTGIKIETGIFQEHMEVSLINDGPVTMIIEK